MKAAKIKSFLNIIQQVMTNPELRAEWLVDVKTLADRIIPVRTQLREGLTAMFSLSRI